MCICLNTKIGSVILISLDSKVIILFNIAFIETWQKQI